MCGINPARLQSGGQTVYWLCPRGHEESDETPLQKRPYCVTCDQFFEWDDVTQRGRVRELERVPMPAGLV